MQGKERLEKYGRYVLALPRPFWGVHRFYMSNLGIRLEKAIEIISETEDNRLFADVGSDHAFLPIEILKRGIARRAIAADVNRFPLEKGRENAEEAGVEMDFILSDGFDGLEEFDVTSAAVCGMGGELIAKMLLRSKVAKKCRLVLQPMSAQEELRKALWDNGFNIISESYVTEGGKPYTLMNVVFDGIKRDYTYNQLFLGKETVSSPEFSEYCKKIKAAAEKRRLGIVAKNLPTDEIDGLIDFCHLQITKI